MNKKHTKKSVKPNNGLSNKGAEVLVVISDLHCGSSVGLAHPESEMSTGNIVGFGRNHHQSWLWEKWMEAKNQIKEIVGEDPAVLLVNGDATEGTHHHNQEIIAVKIEEHSGIAQQCIEALVEETTINKILIVKGTECHTRDFEDLLAERLNAETGKAKDKWLFRIKGCLVDAAHHMTTASRKYLEAGMLSIHLGNNRLNCVDAGYEAPKVVLRAHRHCGGTYSNGAAMIGVTGGWQFLTRYGKKVVTDSIPSPTVLVLDWRESKQGELPKVHEIKFIPPQDEIVDL
jgi:hypothetical protein